MIKGGKRNAENIEEKINSIFSNGTFNDEIYVTYNVFIIRDGDTLDSIMEKYNVTQDELEKYNVIKELVDHNGNKKHAALKLGLSIRQINRLIKKYKEKGKSGFIHGNRSKKPAKTLDKSFSDNIILLYQSKYQGFNFTHFYEYLVEIENIHVSYHFVYTTLMNNGIHCFV